MGNIALLVKLALSRRTTTPRSHMDRLTRISIVATKITTGPVCLAFEPVDGGRGRACRSSYWTPSELDNYGLQEENFLYNLHVDIASLWGCQSLCMADTGCDGIEYSPNFDSGRCEVWELGITPAEEPDSLTSAPSPGFTCLKHNPHGIHFHPVQGGQNQACRRANSSDNSHDFYQLVTGVETIFACELNCVRLPSCLGIVYHDNGRCELWTQTVNATKSVLGNTCMQIEEYWRVRRVMQQQSNVTTLLSKPTAAVEPASATIGASMHTSHPLYP